MQTSNRKLSLHRETIRVLNAHVLVLARGGGGRDTVPGDTAAIHFTDTTSETPPTGKSLCNCPITDDC